jgi:hypothetical protein
LFKNSVVGVGGKQDYAEEMKRLNAECAMWIDKIDTETKRVEELEGAIATLYADEYSSKKAMGGVHAASEHNRATQIHIHILENRVHKVIIIIIIIFSKRDIFQKPLCS